MFFFFKDTASTEIYFFFNDTATTEFYTLSLHDALPILIFWIQILSYLPLVQEGTTAGFLALGSCHNQFGRAHV